MHILNEEKHDTTEQQQLYEEALMFLYRSMPDLALARFFDLLEMTNPQTGFYYILQVDIADTYRQKREYKKGLELLYSVLSSRYAGDKAKNYAWTRIAAIYNEWKELDVIKDSVVKYSKLSMQNALDKGYEEYYALSANELGYIYKMEKKYGQAEDLFKEALEIYQELDMKQHVAGVVVNLGSMYIDTHKFTMADSLLDIAIDTCDPVKDKNLLMRLVLQKANLSATQKNYRAAYHQLEEARKLQESFFVDRLDKEIMEMAARYDLQLKETRLAEAKLENEKHRKENIILVGVVFLFGAFLLAGMIIYRLKQKNTAQKQSLAKMQYFLLQKDYDTKNKELLNALASSITTDEILEDLKKEIQKGNTYEANQLINSNISSEKKWQQFLYYFNQNYPNFTSRLKDAHPHLTDYELKISALLKTGLRSIEIASILHIALSSVNKSRQRLRKKLGLDSETNFTDYFNQF